MRQIRLHTTRATEGVHITLAGRNVNTQIALVEHVTIDHAARDDAGLRGVRDAMKAERCDCVLCKRYGFAKVE